VRLNCGDHGVVRFVTMVVAVFLIALAGKVFVFCYLSVGIC